MYLWKGARIGEPGAKVNPRIGASTRVNVDATAPFTPADKRLDKGRCAVVARHGRGVCMPYFAIHCIDKPDSADLRAATRADHLRHIASVTDSVLVAGPLLGLDGVPIGSLLIIDFADRKAAIQFAADDPYALAGLFASVAVTAWKKVVPAS